MILITVPWRLLLCILCGCEIQHSTPTDTAMKTRFMRVMLCLLLALVEVHSQLNTYLTFMGNDILNHSYVDLNTVGTDKNDSVLCHTHLTSCCSANQGPDRGDWYFPNGNRLDFSGNVFEGRGAQIVHLRYTGSDGTSGIYRCDIKISFNRHKIMYVGLYTSGGEESVLYIIMHIYL